ncbi:MAG: Crp/Fnr family transcriptional regulator, partial [Rhodospirillales bacterium]|nr:Crp/Fnr family transcriptional regulator [Rhodospirillales bacterium]
QDLEIVRRAPLFSDVSEDLLQALLADARVAEYSRGQILFLRGDPAERFYLLLDGWVKIFLDTPAGEQTVLEIMKTGETIAEAAIFLGMAFPASAEIAGDARLLEIPAQQFMAKLHEESGLAITMLGALSKRLHFLIQHIEGIQTHSTPQRLAGFLVGLSGETEGKSEVSLPYDKSLIAARLGMKPESLSRALAKLREWGVTTQGNVVSIADVDRLREFSESGE